MATPQVLQLLLHATIRFLENSSVEQQFSEALLSGGGINSVRPRFTAQNVVCGGGGGGGWCPQLRRRLLLLGQVDSLAFQYVQQGLGTFEDLHIRRLEMETK